jgi:hypothetical protein
VSFQLNHSNSRIVIFCPLVLFAVIMLIVIMLMVKKIDDWFKMLFDVSFLLREGPVRHFRDDNIQIKLRGTSMVIENGYFNETESH